MPTTLLQSDLPGLTLRHRGKVRDVFDLPRDRLPADAPEGDCLLMVATDRLSAFDVVLPDPIPGKGEMLCQISNFWFDKTAHLIANHLTHREVAEVLPDDADVALYARRSVVVKALKPVPVEAIARGYLIGSGWKDYQRSGAVCGIALPAGLQQAQQLPEPIFTPSTKAAAISSLLTLLSCPLDKVIAPRCRPLSARTPPVAGSKSSRAPCFIWSANSASIRA